MSKLEIVKTIHKGHRSKILLVKRGSKLCIWKRSASGKSSQEKSIRRQLGRIRKWKKFDLSEIKAKWYKDGVLKNYIKGEDLKDVIKDDNHFFSGNSKELKALKKFLANLIESGRFIHDLKMLNIIYDGHNFQIIDSGPIYKMGYSKLKKEYNKILYIKWSKYLHATGKSELKKFLKKTL